LEKIITKKNTKKEKKNHVRKYCSNPQCFVRKGTVLSPHDLALLILLVIVILNQLNIKKNKIKKENLKKKHKKPKKNQVWKTL
jgi:hypothetical protein